MMSHNINAMDKPPLVFLNTTRMLVVDAVSMMQLLSTDNITRRGKNDIFHATVPYHDDKLHMLAKTGDTLSVERYLPQVIDTYHVFGAICLILQVNISYKKNLKFVRDFGRGVSPSGELLPEGEGWFYVDKALPEHKLVMETFPHAPYIVLVTGNDKPNAMTEDFLRKRWREISDVEDFPIIPYAGNENFREQFLKTVEAMVDKILQKPD